MSDTERAYSFYAMMDRMRLIRRWSLMRNTFSENLAEHSLMVGMIAHALALLRNCGAVEGAGPPVNADRIAVMGMYHDAPEIITGDLPTPIKYYDASLREAYARVEASALERLLSFLPEYLETDYRGLMEEAAADETTKEAWRFVRAADKISAYVKCIQEVKAGNSEFVPALEQTLRKIRMLALPEADLFMKEFVAAFSLSLDELNPG
jgi:5'-deoxynucleotidase